MISLEMNDHAMLTISEASRLLHVHPNTLRRWSNSGIIRSQRVNIRGDRRFRQEDVVNLLSQMNTHEGYPKYLE